MAASHREVTLWEEVKSGALKVMPDSSSSGSPESSGKGLDMKIEGVRGGPLKLDLGK